MYSEGFLQYLMSEELSKIDGINWLTLFVHDCTRPSLEVLVCYLSDGDYNAMVLDLLGPSCAPIIDSITSFLNAS
jgi:hypothetical protein